MTGKINYLPFTIQIVGYSYLFYLNRLDGEEILSKPFTFQLVAESFDSLGDLKQYLGAPVVFKIHERQWHGYITELKQSDLVTNLKQYSFIIHPWTALMNAKLKSRIFKNINILEVISIVFNEEKNAFYRIECQQKYTSQDYIIQYKETNFQFISRLLASANIFYYFIHENDRHIMILMDNPRYLPSIKDLKSNSNHVIDWQERCSIKKTDHLIDGKSFNSQLSPGYRLINESCFITRVIHCCSSKNSEKMLINAFYYNYFRLHHLNAYQVLPKTQLSIKGHQCAKVTRSNKKLFSMDNKSRISIQFPWDSNKTFIWASFVQGQAGNHYGHQWLPIEAEDVLVMFYDGDPHQPFIINSIVNKEHTNDFHITNSCCQPDDHFAHYNQLVFDKEKKTASIRIKASRNLYWQSNANIKQYINGNYFIKSKSSRTYLKNNCIFIKANRRIIFKVGEAIIQLTEGIFKIAAPKIRLKNNLSAPCFSAASVGDTHTCPRITAEIPHQGGPITKGASSVFINGKPAARVGDPAPCNLLIDKVISGASQILFEGLPASRRNDNMQHGGKISSGSSNVHIGSAENINNFSAQKIIKKNENFYIKIN